MNTTAETLGHARIKSRRVIKRSEIKPQTGDTISGDGPSIGQIKEAISHGTTTVSAHKMSSNIAQRKTKPSPPITERSKPEDRTQERTTSVKLYLLHNNNDRRNRSSQNQTDLR